MSKTEPLPIALIGGGGHARQILIPALEQIPEAIRLVALAFELTDAALHQSTFSLPYGRNQQLYLRGYIPELEEFARCVRDRAAPLSGVDDAEQSLLIREAVAASVTAGGNWTPVTQMS